MKVSITNMVCNRSIIVVWQEFEKAGLKPLAVKIGEVELDNIPSDISRLGYGW